MGTIKSFTIAVGAHILTAERQAYVDGLIA